MFSYLHNLVHALKLSVAKYQAFPVVHRGLYLYYIYYTFEHICMLSLFIMQALRISINSEWCRIVSVVVAHAVATSLIMRRDVIISLLYSPAIFDVIVIIIFYYL